MNIYKKLHKHKEKVNYLLYVEHNKKIFKFAEF